MRACFLAVLVSSGCAKDIDSDAAYVYHSMATCWGHLKVLEDGPHDTAKLPKVYRFLVNDPRDGEVEITYHMKDGRLTLFRALPRSVMEKYEKRRDSN